MNNSEFDETLSRMLTQNQPVLPASSFVVDIKHGVSQINRRKLRSRVLWGAALALIAIPLQDVGVALTLVFATALVPLAPGVVADLLAPINSVGSVLSLVLLTIRWLYRRY